MASKYRSRSSNSSGVMEPPGASRASHSMPKASRWIRSGELNQSTGTRNLASACFNTQASPTARSTHTVRFETPPCKTAMRGRSSAAMRPVSRRYIASAGRSSISSASGNGAFHSGVGTAHHYQKHGEHLAVAQIVFKKARDHGGDHHRHRTVQHEFQIGPARRQSPDAPRAVVQNLPQQPEHHQHGRDTAFGGIL